VINTGALGVAFRAPSAVGIVDASIPFP